jgi:hypothetical protein
MKWVEGMRERGDKTEAKQMNNEARSKYEKTTRSS